MTTRYLVHLVVGAFAVGVFLGSLITYDLVHP
jgi:hypothetical protein